ncbi:MAG: hypothetical protein JRN26_05150 [Nitrososphaerota archaeon]|jgi:hypothetical protein|nr:hypothetical protein [Nitrososphaerota archaeon]MDG6928069.1 hypothetical protein [Nitrososphaerota archaeon]MDG6931342.1 hypothetical protein [Nitrososphaerota archaeon]MDG6931673.1 hypothetical protein [Nitrososphaerota archaeon]MDG6936252.1 hypothetical protein [Nitrososphaerota archaeon]
MKVRTLSLYYLSIIIYILGGLFVIAYSLIIKPISEMYNEQINIMVSPVFGNYAVFLSSLFYVALSLTGISLVLFIMVLILTRNSKKSLSKTTLLLTGLLYVFAFAALLVTAP